MVTQSIFFDLDGTLTDPKPGITGCIQHALAKLDEPQPSSDDLTWCIGPPLQESFAKLVGESRAAEAVKIYRERFADIGLFENSVYEGIETCLSNLSEQGIDIHIASSKPQIYVSRILQHFELDQFFKHIFGSELDGTRTDKTDLLKFALEESGAQAATSTMIGDRKHDIIGAKNNHIKPIGVLYGYGSKQELEEAGAEHLVDSPKDLESTLKASLKQS